MSLLAAGFQATFWIQAACFAGAFGGGFLAESPLTQFGPAAALSSDTRPRQVLESIRSTAYFYNISRGSTVDEAALCQLLAQGRIAGAGLDVTAAEPLAADGPLWELGDNVLITGHSAGISANFPDRFCNLAVNNLVRFYRAEPLVNRVI